MGGSENVTTRDRGRHRWQGSELRAGLDADCEQEGRRPAAVLSRQTKTNLEKKIRFDKIARGLIETRQHITDAKMKQ